MLERELARLRDQTTLYRRLTGEFISQVQLVEGFREPAESAVEIRQNRLLEPASHGLNQSRSLSTFKLPTTHAIAYPSLLVERFWQAGTFIAFHR